MRTKAVPVCLALAALLPAPGCWVDNKPEYEGITALQRGENGLGDEPIDDPDVAGDAAADDTSADDDNAPVGADDDAMSADGDSMGGEDDDSIVPDDEASTDDDVSLMTPIDGGGPGDTNEDEDPNSDCAVTDTLVDPDSPFYPPCCLGPALNGEEIKKGTQCTAADVQKCYRVCGPLQLGWKTEECLAGVYAEGDCGFPQDDPHARETLLLETGAEDYSCFAVPREIDATVCPQDAPPQSTAPCDVPQCTLCNLRTLYADTNGTTKEGYCVCRPPDANGERTWTCASVTAWPCPFSDGC